MDRLQYYEINSLLDAVNYSDRSDWERTRMLMYVTAQVNSTKKIKMTDILEFPWDNIEHNHSIEDNDIQRLKEKAKKISDKYMQ